MATTQIGKLKLHASKRGLAYKWGDGKIHRLSFERKPKGEVDTAEVNYGDGRYVDPSEAQNGFGGYDADGYDGGYDDGGSPYGDIPDDVPEKYRFLYTNKWLMYVLLAVLPPLGIWIMWKKGVFSQTVRTIITALSAIWFVILLVWLFNALLGSGRGGNDVVNQQQTAVNNASTISVDYGDGTQTGTTSTQPEPTPLNTGVTGTVDGTSIVPADTTVSTEDTEGTDVTDTEETEADASLVYATNTGMYYHASKECPNIDNGAVLVGRDIARSRGQVPCPTCIEATGTEDGTSSTGTYYMTSGGKYYHTDPTCGGMKNAKAVTLAAAQKAGKKVCPTCIGSYWATSTGKYYHTQKNCSGMSGAKRITKSKAVSAGKKPCPKCVSKSSSSKSSSSASKTKTTKTYYATRSGKYYHVKSDCGGMKGAVKVSLTTAKKYGKKACPKCIGKSTTSSGTKTTSSTAGKTTSASTYYYATEKGNYYHKTKSCTRLKGIPGVKKVTKATAVKYGKTACPTCLASSGTSSSSQSSSSSSSKTAATKVYATSGGRYYHKNRTCSGIKNARSMTLAAAKAKGKTACPTCYKSSSAKTTYYYATSSNKYYHNNKTCSGMKNASKVTLATAKAKGKIACPVCVKKTASKTATTYCYASAGNKYYHKKSNCSGISGLSKVTLAYAKAKGKTACPVCVSKTATPKPVKKVFCYASSGSKYYHKNRNCSGMKNARKVLLSTARKKGRTACPICVLKKTPKKATTSAADKKTICYASGSSAFYHANSACVSGLKKTTVFKAKAKGKTACPTCSGKSLTTYVYVSKNGVKYHRKSNCSGLSNAYKVSLDTALRYNFVRCTKCNAPKAS